MTMTMTISKISLKPFSKNSMIVHNQYVADITKEENQMKQTETDLVTLIKGLRKALELKQAPNGWTLDQVRSIYVVFMDIAAAANVPTTALE